MNPTLLLLISNATSITCAVSAAVLAYKGKRGWGWFLFAALLSCFNPNSTGG